MSTSTVLFASLPLLSACAAARLLPPPTSETPHRFALGVSAPRVTHRVSGVELAVHDSDPGGGKPTILCLHAIGHGGGDFDNAERALGDRFRFVTVDWPGHGYSGSDVEPASAPRYTVLLEELVGTLGLDHVVLVGNSIGGAVAIRYAARHPDKVRALVLANPGGLDPAGSSFLGRLYIGNLLRHFAWGARREARFASWFASYYDRILITPEARTRKEAIVAAGYESAPLLEQAWDSFRQPEANIVPLLSQLEMPVLVTWARQDRLVSWGRNRAAVAKLPHARVEMFAAGHSAFLEAPDAFNRALAAFVDGLAPVRDGGAAGSGGRE